MRKLIIWIAVLAVVVGAFIVVNRLIETPELTVRQNNNSGDIKVPIFDSQGNTIKNINFGPVEQSVFLTVDEKTGKVKSIFGYDEFLNPAQGSSRWRLRKPYMKVYEDKFMCEVTADTGNVEVDTTGKNPTASDFRLSGHVKIAIVGTDQANPIACTIHLDDVDYSSERSEFATNGRVKVISENSEMVGTGMLLLYNPARGRVEYLSIVDLDYIHVKDVAALSELGDDARPAGPEIASGTNQETIAAKTDTDETNAEAEQVRSRDYYTCRLDNNVSIRYGRQLKVIGADLVSIDNILWSDADREDNAPVADDATVDETVPEAVAVDLAQPLTDASKKEDIYITCDGGVVVRPLQEDEIVMAGTEPAGCFVELKGKAMEVREILDDKGTDVTVAKSGIIKYDVDRNRLEMRPFDNDGLVTLNMAKSERDTDIVGSSLETAGSVTWLRDEDRAKVYGPGRLVMVNRDGAALDADKPQQTAEMLFDGPMDVAFAQDPGDSTGESLLIKSAVFTDGLSAQVKGGDQGGAKMSADSAQFAFDDTGNIDQAELKGNVKFDSKRGNLTTEHARIYFADNDQGKTDAVRVLCPGSSQLELYGKDKTKKNARFYADSLDHNILAGDTVAGGPVKFVFYTDDLSMMGSDNDKAPDTVADADKPQNEQWPVVVTANDDARYFAASQQIIFTGDVVGSRESRTDQYVTKSTFYGDTLTVEMIKLHEIVAEVFKKDEMQLSRITMAGENVKFDTVRQLDGLVVNHVVLKCQRIDYEETTKILTAVGPGKIEINNENAPEVAKEEDEKDGQGSKLSLEGPCYALIDAFDRLTWDTDNSRISAWSNDDVVNVGYWPIVNGKAGNMIRAEAKKIDAEFIRLFSGKTELSHFTASDGVSYEEQGGHVFEGDSIDLDNVFSEMVVKGTDKRPCSLNGIRVPIIRYNLFTGDLSTEISNRPGVFVLPTGKK